MVLSAKQLTGDRSLLISQPDSVRLLVRSVKRGRTSTAVPPVLPWRPYNGRTFPEGPMASTTVFNGTAFRTLQDALLAFLLWIHGGATGVLTCRH